MAALTDNIGLVMRISADSTDAVRDLNKVQGEIRGVGTAGGTAAGGLSSMVNPATLAAAGLAALAAAAVTGISALYNLTKAASDYGGEIFDAQVKTGLTAATLGTLKLNADNAGSSFDKITGSVVKFSQLIGQANQGNEKAIATLNKYGITATTTDGALQQAIATIAAMESADQRAIAAKELFKDKTAELLPVIDQMAGDLAAATKESQRLGTQISEKNIRAADAFGDTMGILNAQLGAAGRTIGFALMPELTKMANYLSEFLARNQAQIASVGDRLATVFSRIILGFNTVKNWIENNQGVIRVALAFMTLGASEVMLAGTKAMIDLVDRMSSGRQVAPTPQEYAGQATPGFTSEVDPAVAKAEADKRAAERKAERDRELNALQDNIRLRIKAETDQFDTIQTEWETAFIEKRETEETWRTESEKNFAVYAAKVKKMLLDAFKLDAVGKTPLEIENLRLGKDSANKTVDNFVIKSREDREKTITGVVKKEDKEREVEQKEHFARLKEALEQDADENIAIIKAYVDQVRADMALLASLPSVPLPVPTMSQEGNDTRFPGGLAGVEAFDLFGQQLNENLTGDKLTAATAGIQAMQTAFSALGQAVGEAVKGFVLFGTAGGGIRKFAANLIASIAQMAAIQAIWELAQGFAMLAQNFFWPDPKLAASATAHFHSAAIYGGIAGIAAGAGRAVAGDSFSQESAGGGGANTQNNGNNNQNGNEFSSGQFGGFGQRLNNTLAQVEETTNRLATKIAGFRPGDVLGMGVEENPNAVSDGLISGLQNNSRLTGALKRATGDV